MSEIAQLFTEFFRDLDVVPSDIVAGLVLLRHHQKHRMKTIISQSTGLLQGTNDVYQYLSGVPVTPSTQFLQLTQPEVTGEFIKVIHYMRGLQDLDIVYATYHVDGMVQAALYIKKKLVDHKILDMAWERDEHLAVKFLSM
nr:hypothetical protein BaRGS_023718 [Batillaria attramentaria]